MEHSHFIGDISKRLGISQRTIRYYEELGLLKPSRSSGGFRKYDESQVERLRTILLLKELGMSLDEIVSLINVWHDGAPADVSPKLREMLVKRRKDFREMISKYQRGIVQLEAVIKLLNICASCGKSAKEISQGSVCSDCLSKHDEELPSLMKALM